MAKKRSGSSAPGARHAKNARHTTDSNIDFSDIPELTDTHLKSARRVGRPVTGKAKRLIALRVAPSLLTQLRKLAALQDKSYQTLMHEILEEAVKRKAA